jgi:hypothetical protein
LCGDALLQGGRAYDWGVACETEARVAGALSRVLLTREIGPHTASSPRDSCSIGPWAVCSWASGWCAVAQAFPQQHRRQHGFSCGVRTGGGRPQNASPVPHRSPLRGCVPFPGLSSPSSARVPSGWQAQTADEVSRRSAPQVWAGAEGPWPRERPAEAPTAVLLRAVGWCGGAGSGSRGGGRW